MKISTPKYYKIQDSSGETTTNQWLTPESVRIHQKMGLIVTEIFDETDDDKETCDFCRNLKAYKEHNDPCVTYKIKSCFIVESSLNDERMGSYRSVHFPLNFCPVCGKEIKKGA